MPDLLKDRYSYEVLHKLASEIQSVYNAFQADEFIKSTAEDTWDALGLKDRVYKISSNLGKYLPSDYKTAISILDKVVANYGSWLDPSGLFFTIFIELYGQDEKDWNTSIAAFERYPQYASAENAVRSFIIKNEERMMAQMVTWSKHKSEHVRRLSCEGCRPQLPMAQSLPNFKKDPTPILPILTQLKNDPSPHVRKSVANNLNDISKTRPDVVVRLAKDWYGKSEYTDWIVKHGCRTLLKNGDRDVLAIFGYDDGSSIDVTDFTLEATVLAIGEDITFSFTIFAKGATKARLEYAIDYVKSNGKRSRKVFKISETSLKENERKSYSKKHSFADVSIRKHYPGLHSVTLIVNGVERGTLDFKLEA